MYLVAYHIEMPWEKSSSKEQSDYCIQFLTHQISHPEVVDDERVLGDACSRIPHLKNFISILRKQDPSQPGVLPRIASVACSSISPE